VIQRDSCAILIYVASLACNQNPHKRKTYLNGYDEIAESWYRLRHKTRFISELEEMVARWKGGRLLNIGCAHGPDFIPFKESFELYGLDSSAPMIEMALKHSAKFQLATVLTLGDAVTLPFKDNTFDCAISVAAYHHIKERNQRDEAFRELRRVLKPGAEAFITVWNRWQSSFWNKGREVMVPWNVGDKKIMRYYYLYNYPELESVLKKAGFTVLRMYPENGYRLKIKYFSRNICALIRAD
jgi:tRNA (uracil-5-)-methyltransferase TRM9